MTSPLTASVSSSQNEVVEQVISHFPSSQFFIP